MSNFGAPIKVLAGLTCAVVLAHLAILQGRPSSLQASERALAKPFSTRSVAVAPVAVESPAPQPALAPARLAPAAPTPRPVRPTPTPKVTQASATSPSTSSLPAAEQAVAGLPDTFVTGPIAPTPPTPPDVAKALPEPDPAVAPAKQATAPVAAPKPAAKPLPETPAAEPLAALSPAQDAAKVAKAAGAASLAKPDAVSVPPAPKIAYLLPGSTLLKYNVKAAKGNLNFDAGAELLWQQDGSSYNARLEVSAFLVFTRAQTSVGRITAEGLAPTRFSDKFRTELAAHFEREKGLVTFSANTPQVPLLAGMQDQLSVFMQLAGMLAGAPAKYPAGTVLTFETVGPRSPETWVVTVEGDETLSLPGGEQVTRKLTRKPRGEYDQTSEVWLAPALGYLPARIKLTEKNGDFVDQLWRGSFVP